MAYYPDLTKYDYSTKYDNEKAVNIGWLDKGYKYSTGELPKKLLNKILRFCSEPVNKTRGYHLCPLCENPSFGVRVELDNGEYITLGSAEIEIKRHDSLHYICPDLIYHYIEAHGYQPPEEFIEALENHRPGKT